MVIPDSVAVKRDTNKYNTGNDDVRSAIFVVFRWNRIKSSYLQKERKVEYVYTYVMKSFNWRWWTLICIGSGLMLLMKRNFAGITPWNHNNKWEKVEAYRRFEIFPASQIAANNLWRYCIARRKDGKSTGNIIRVGPSIHRGVLTSCCQLLCICKQLWESYRTTGWWIFPEARYNLGLITAKKRYLNEAYELFRPRCRFEYAIVAWVSTKCGSKIYLSIFERYSSGGWVCSFAYSCSFVGWRCCFLWTYCQCLQNDMKLRERVVSGTGLPPVFMRMNCSGHW